MRKQHLYVAVEQWGANRSWGSSATCWFCVALYLCMCVCRRVCMWLWMYSCLSDICTMCGVTCRRSPYPLKKLNWVHRIPYRSISIMYRQDGHEGKQWIIPLFKGTVQNCISPAASPHSLPLCVFVSLQPRALSILLWQWNSDDEPCLQGTLPQGRPHTNKYTIVNNASIHTFKQYACIPL